MRRRWISSLILFISMLFLAWVILRQNDIFAFTTVAPREALLLQGEVSPGGLQPIEETGRFELNSSPITTDPRFFGTYCGDATLERKVKVTVTFLGVPLYTETRTITIDIENIRLHADYIERVIKGKTVGIVNGRGTYELDGKDFSPAFGGIVRSPGVLRGTFDPGIEGQARLTGNIILSLDGLAVRIRFGTNSITLRKDRCGNDFPEVTIESPDDGDSLEFGRTFIFRGTVDDEDETFPPERMVWRSDRDGILSGYSFYGPNSARLFINDLSPGNHTITFSATDSGGLTASDTINISVINRSPGDPIIFKPRAGDLVFDSVPITFLGNAYDLEDGFIIGTGLTWSSDVDGSIGFGSPRSFTFLTPGTRSIRLTAEDSTGSTSFSEVMIEVLPYEDNSPPQVRIMVPEYFEWQGMAITTGDIISFVGNVADFESPIDDLTFKWEAVPINPAGPVDEFGSTTTADKEFIAIGGSSTTYEITFSATDPDGLTGEDSMTLVVLSHIIE